jgi:Protein of unknown function (DUF1573)
MKFNWSIGFCFIFIHLFFLASAQAPTAATGASITWEKPSYDFGDIAKGDKVSHTFKFENTGTEPLIITNVEVTCGCTIPKGWPRDPVMPGDKGEIEVQFDSTGKFGRQTKVITIVSNASSGNSQITFTANIL